MYFAIGANDYAAAAWISDHPMEGISASWVWHRAERGRNPAFVDEGEPMGNGDRSKTREAAGVVREQGQQVAERVGSEASEVAGAARDQAGQVKDEVATQARGLVDQAKNELRQQGESQADQVAQAIRRVCNQTEALAEGRVDDAGAVADYVRRAGDQVCRVADHIEQRGVDGVVNDVQDFARRRPGAFLLGCATAGFVAGRLIRGGAASSGGSVGGGDGERGRSTQTSAYAPPMA
jgi:uncharacterized protein YjbJ (UPF0337 family)